MLLFSTLSSEVTETLFADLKNMTQLQNTISEPISLANEIHEIELSLPHIMEIFPSHVEISPLQPLNWNYISNSFVNLGIQTSY